MTALSVSIIALLLLGLALFGWALCRITTECDALDAIAEHPQEPEYLKKYECHLSPEELDLLNRCRWS